MSRISSFWVAVLTTAFLLATLPAHADFETGMKAYRADDYETAMKEWLPLAEAGNAKAQYWVGNIHDSIHGTPKDFSNALRWFTRAANIGYAPAQFAIADMYYDGRIGERDHIKALEWYQKAADQGHPPGMLMTGLILIGGDGVERDYVKGFMWLFLSEAKNAPKASEAIEYFGNLFGDQVVEAGHRLAETYLQSK